MIFNVGDPVLISQTADFEFFGNIYNRARGKTGVIEEIDTSGPEPLYILRVKGIRDPVPCYGSELAQVQP